jgi:hypothetical protein
MNARGGAALALVLLALVLAVAASFFYAGAQVRTLRQQLVNFGEETNKKFMLMEERIGVLDRSSLVYKRDNQVCCSVNADACNLPQFRGNMIGHIARRPYWNGERFVVDQLCFVPTGRVDASGVQEGTPWSISNPGCAKVEILLEPDICDY